MAFKVIVRIFRRLKVDGQRYQDGSTSTMVFGVAKLVSYLSHFMSLQPGDIISTGTPSGVGLGQKPPIYLREGNSPWSEIETDSAQKPWQNGIAERFVGSSRRDLLDHVIVLSERHLKRLMAEYIRYHHNDPTHLGLDKQTPAGRVPAMETMMSAKIVSAPRLGGLHHRYDLAT
jgi:hypothetical protein